MSDVPPLSGIARKQRSDKGVPRKSTMAAFYDRFLDFTAEDQKTALDVMEALHRQVVKGRIAPAEENADAK